MGGKLPTMPQFPPRISLFTHPITTVLCSHILVNCSIIEAPCYIMALPHHSKNKITLEMIHSIIMKAMMTGPLQPPHGAEVRKF